MVFSMLEESVHSFPKAVGRSPQFSLFIQEIGLLPVFSMLEEGLHSVLPAWQIKVFSNFSQLK